MSDRSSGMDTLMEASTASLDDTVLQNHLKPITLLTKPTTMQARHHSTQNPNMNDLDTMTFEDLETMKQQLDTVRRRILQLQNAQSLLFRLPGEVRNKIMLFAMHAELAHRKEHSRHNFTSLFVQPAFFRTSRQVYVECLGVWLNEILVWEEFSVDSKDWRRLEMAEVRELCHTGEKYRIITQLAHCDLGRTKQSVEGSQSICPRRGVVRVQSDLILPQLRWWIW
ncbi:Hypothetical predicted protein [Lecanosticta acicola]|uniref:Uncharacterized protein n=1 Tax=Lecanosticta acicola TaxID=111012 RepID=A0AAI8YXE9_9PEZI|nr:Hypothetical predicted protein [Lecanosticta acicola]